MNSNGHASADDDELLFEVDVHLHRTKQSIYLFQYPLRPSYRPYDEASFTNARIKEKYSLIEMDLFVDAQSTNYYAARGKQLAESINQDQGKQFFNSDRMDKQTIATSNSLSGEHYFIGLFDSTTRNLILCPLKSIVQLRPQFAYLDPANNASSSNRDNGLMDDDAMNASDGDQSGSESEETKPDLAASLVTMKFAKKESEYHKKKRLQSYGYYRQLLDEDRWQDLVCIMNADSFEAQHLREDFLFNERPLLPKQEATEPL